MKVLLSTTCLLISPLFAHCETLFSDDFSSYSADGSLPIVAPWVRVTNPDSDDAIIVKADTESIFGQNDTNQYLALQQKGEDPSYSLNAVAEVKGMTDVGRINAELLIPRGDDYKGVLLLRIGSGNSNDKTAFAVAVGTGKTGGKIYDTQGENLGTKDTLGGFDYDKPYRLSIVYNASSEPYTYDGRTVEPNTMDVWLDSKQIGHSLPAAPGIINGHISTVNFVAFPTVNARVFLDNFTIESLQ